MNENKQCCENCRYFAALELFQRYIGTLGSPGAVCGWEVRIKNDVMSEKEYGCCTVFLEDAKHIYETDSTDICEKWKSK